MTVMLQKNSGAVPELMTHVVLIIWAEEEYAEGAWMCYDVAYHQQAVACQNTTRSKVKPSLFSLCFTGKAQTLSQCDLCQACMGPESVSVGRGRARCTSVPLSHGSLSGGTETRHIERSSGKCNDHWSRD